MREPLAVVFQQRATREIEAIDEWWRENRPSAPDLFLREIERALSAIALVPGMGAPAKSSRVAGVRRVLLPKTRYQLHYRVRSNTVEILAVWHPARGSGPGV